MPDELAASVIVPTHRGAHRLPPLLDALIGQTASMPFEVVVVIDGVVDGTMDVLGAYADRLMLRPVVRPTNGGVVAALNDGIEAAAGRVIIRCDDDLTPHPDFVHRHVAWHSDDSLRGVIGLTKDVMPDTPYARAYGIPSNERARAAAYRRDQQDVWIHWAANNSLLRSTAAAVGPYNPLFAFGEDSEMGWRLRQMGVELLIDPQLETPHRGAATSARVRIPRAYVSGASRRQFSAVHAGNSHVVGPAPRSLWDSITSAVAHLARSRETYARLGRVVDRALPILPRTVAAKLIALGVEGAGKAGHRWGGADLARYQDAYSVQRSTEPRSEPH